MIKEIFQLLLDLISSPGKAWLQLIKEEETNPRKFFKSYLYPVMGMVALAAFLGVFFAHKGFDLQIALKEVIKQVFSVFLGFHLASFFLSEAQSRILKQERDLEHCRRFVGYSSALIYAVYILRAIFPEFFFLDLAVLYSVYIIWEGVEPYLFASEKEKLKLTVYASVIVISSTYIVKYILYLLIPGLKV